MKHPDTLFLAYDFRTCDVHQMSEVYPFAYVSKACMERKIDEALALLHEVDFDQVDLFQHDKIQSAIDILETEDDDNE